MERKSKTEYKGTETWCRIDRSTGEILEEKEVDVINKQVGRKEPFMITYIAEIINLIDSLGNKKMQVVKYILAHMEKSNNSLIITSRELAEKTNTSLQTVTDTLKILSDAKIIKRKTGAIMVHPRLMNNKNAKGEAILMTRYSQFAEDEDIPGQMNVVDFPGMNPEGIEEKA